MLKQLRDATFWTNGGVMVAVWRDKIGNCSETGARSAARLRRKTATLVSVRAVIQREVD
jgi:hypothetical protein